MGMMDMDRDEMRDRFYDEVVIPEEPVPTCADCSMFTECDIPGHEHIGWCRLYAGFMEAEEEQCS